MPVKAYSFDPPRFRSSRVGLARLVPLEAGLNTMAARPPSVFKSTFLAVKSHMQLKSIIESILFVYGEPLTLERLVEITERNENEVKTALTELEKDYQSRGLVLLEKEGAYQLGTSPAVSNYVEKLVKKEYGEELSRASLETLAIVAYKGPISRAKIEYVRGVNSSFILRSLLMRGLVERIIGSEDARVFLYRISFDFLRYLGVTKVEELPKFETLIKERIEILEEPK